MEEKKVLPQNEVKIQIDEQTSNGVYSNLAMIAHSENEFVLDFIFFQPQNVAKVRSRIIMSPVQIKMTLQALQENVLKYEQKYGEIKTQQMKTQGPKNGGYYN